MCSDPAENRGDGVRDMPFDCSMEGMRPARQKEKTHRNRRKGRRHAWMDGNDG